MKLITKEVLNDLQSNYLKNEKQHILKAALVNNGLETVAADFERSREQQFLFSHDIKTLPVTNQMQSGRCWIFAGLNYLREVVALKYDLKSFEFSQSYLAFWDKFEKANYFMETMNQLVDVPQDDRTLQFLLSEGIQDGGQWDMFTSLVNKYGLVPKDVMPETHQSSHTGFLNKMINYRLRKYASDLRSKLYDQKTLKQAAITEIYELLVSSYGIPVDKFDFEFKTQSGEYHAYNNLTPSEFYDNHVGVDLNEFVSIINAPTSDKPFYETYTVKHLGNIVGGKQILHLNLPLNEFRELTIKQLVDRKLVWFGCDVSTYGDRKKGIWDDQSYQYQNVYGLNLKMSKEEMLNNRQSQMNHAMILTGLHLSDGEVKRFKIQNSWGDTNGNSGFYLASSSWFDKFAYQIVINKAYLTEKQLQALTKKPVELNPWDPMGSLA